MKKFFSNIKNILALISLPVAVWLVASATYEYRQNDVALSEKIQALESELAAVNSALEDSNALSEATKKQLQEISKRSSPGVSASSDNSNSTSLTSTVERAAPAVVSILVSKSQRIGAGSGFIINPDGYILTNSHVVGDTEAEYRATLSSGENKEATIVYRDTTNDIAILKIEDGDYPYISLGNSSSLKLGQTVAAIGNALGQYSNSVSVGIISGLDRNIEARDSRGGTETLSGVIQTDAAINRGNSGGPLLDLSGKAVGINVAMEQGANNIAFAIPINPIKSLIEKFTP